MNNYRKPNHAAWTGRISDNTLYLHEKITCVNLHDDSGNRPFEAKTIALLGYACDEGVARNLGRPGAAKGPEAIRSMLGKMANHLGDETVLADCGDIVCHGRDLESAQLALANTVTTLLERHAFPILLGGSHDIAYAHYRGIARYCATHAPGSAIGIINLDAHFDLRTFDGMGNSGTPFYQIAHEYAGSDFHYLCLGVQRQANTRTLFDTATSLGARYISNDEFNMRNLSTVINVVQAFIGAVDHVYLTIDLDGFSSAIAPGVSAPSPFGFSSDVAVETLKTIGRSGKLLSCDIAELNPLYDQDNQTARLAAGLITTLLAQTSQH